jgi:SsrA-binding protein
MAKKPPPSNERRIVNRKARHDYHILQAVEAGIVLTGSEVKSLRAGAAQLTDAFVRITDTAATIYNFQIDRYPAATDRNHEPLRPRRLLLHRRELAKLRPQADQKGVTLIPLSVYFNARGLAKVELALATGKKEYDKREDLRKRDHQREIKRAMTRRDR